jgi:hypothetical protein
MESPVRSNPHAGFGERSGETDLAKPQHRAPNRLYRGPRCPRLLGHPQLHAEGIASVHGAMPHACQTGHET